MAADSATEADFVECGLCYENDDLKRLPCSPGHIFCVTCLTKDSAETEVIQCPLCKQVFEDEVDALSSANSPLDEFRCCDVCMRKDDKHKLAQHYCVDCKKRFCKFHQEGHNVSLDDHSMITMSEYLKDYRKMETRYCNKHHDQVYSLACKKCYGVFCLFCSPWDSQCRDDNSGGSHQMIALDKFVTELISAIAEKKVWIFDKEETILGIVKGLTRVISDWGTDTEEMIQLIHQARDKQIADIKAKYEALESKLIELRRTAMAEVSNFLDGDIGAKLNKLTREIRILDTRIFTQHKVDVVNGMKDTERLCEELMQMKVPMYTPSESHVTVSSSDAQRENEINANIHRWTCSWDSQPTIALPTSLKLLRKVKVPSCPESVVHHQQLTYVGLQNKTVLKIADESQYAPVFLGTSPHYPNGMVIDNELLYVLRYLKQVVKRIEVYALSGSCVRSFNIGGFGDSPHNKLCISDEKIVVCNKTKKCLSVYSLEGNFIMDTHCENINNGTVSITSGPSNSVIVSDLNSSCVFRVDIKTGNVMWTSKHVTGPRGVTCYEEKYVMVTNGGRQSRIWIMDLETGKYLGEVDGETSTNTSAIVDLHIYGNTLIIPRLHECVVEYYQII